MPAGNLIKKLPALSDNALKPVPALSISNMVAFDRGKCCAESIRAPDKDTRFLLWAKIFDVKSDPQKIITAINFLI